MSNEIEGTVKVFEDDVFGEVLKFVLPKHMSKQDKLIIYKSVGATRSYENRNGNTVLVVKKWQN